jgi:hypothetical protein
MNSHVKKQAIAITICLTTLLSCRSRNIKLALHKTNGAVIKPKLSLLTWKLFNINTDAITIIFMANSHQTHD